MLEILTYPPVTRGFILLLISGFTFPLSGTFILRMNILPIRYLLMHGVLLGGALSLAFSWNITLTCFSVNILLIILLSRTSALLDTDYGHITMFFMIASIAAASIIISIYNVPAKETLSLLWGNLYSGNMISLVTAAAAGTVLVIFSSVYFKHLAAVFHDRDIAGSLGIKTGLFELIIMLITSLVVASAMQLMGALLLDALIILPVVIAGLLSSGLKQTMIISCILGGFFSASGFFISLIFDLPVSAAVAVPSVLLFIIIAAGKKYFKNRDRHQN